MSKRTIVVFDFETTHLDPDSDLCVIVEIGAVALDSRSLKVVPNSEFYVMVAPTDINKEGYYEAHKSTIDWHVGLKPGRTPDGMIETWAKGTPEKDALKMFIDYCAVYKWGRTYDTAPTAGGNNIINYDLPILRRYVEKYKLKYPFFKRDIYDMQQMCLYSLGYSLDAPRSYSMDNLRTYFGLSGEHGHNALFDAQQEAVVISYLGRKFQSLSKGFQARGCLAEQKA